MVIKKIRRIPVIACFNKAKTPLGVSFDALISALQIYVDKHVAPVWGTPAKLVKSKGFVKGAWALVLHDDADRPGVDAYHDLTPDGFPLSKVFVRTSQKDGCPLGVSTSHELVEMLVDPALNLMARNTDTNMLCCYESADPVEATHFNINGIPMSNFVYPPYFESFHKRGSTKFDHLGKVKKPFEILSGGYLITFKDGEWTNLYHSDKKRKKHAVQDRRGHRGHRRPHVHTVPLKRADHKAIKRHESMLAKGGGKGG